MAFRQYTKCYVHTPGDKPFNKSDLAGEAILYGVVPGALFGALTGLAVGFAAGGPIGAIVGVLAGMTVGIALALTEVANRWRYHRLVCLGSNGPKCAVGTVDSGPERGDLGEFDNDEFFDLRLMPHRAGDDYVAPSDNFKSGTRGIVAKDQDGFLHAHPKNDIYTDDFQGSALLQPSIADLPYDTTRSTLHCEAEGDFWQRISDLAPALGLLGAVLTIVTVAAAVGGAVAGFAAGCAALIIFGPIGCLIGGIIGAIIGAALAGGVAAAVSYFIMKAVLQAIFDADPGNVEDANIGDKRFGPITAGDKVAVFGVHVYDGFHEGWHEIHPLMAVIKLDAIKPGDQESKFYLEWDPTFAGDPTTLTLPATLSPAPPADIVTLTTDDIKQGLNSDVFRKRAVWFRDRWCGLLSEAFTPTVRTTQGLREHRWTIHPLVDGCTPVGSSPQPPDIR
jgi:hypothetical protein